MATTDLVRYSGDTLAAIEQVACECGLQSVAGGKFERAFRLSAGIRRLKDMITKDMMRDIMELQGTSLGFRTDKDTGGGYPPEAVKECLIEAILRGAAPVGNEFNIIAGRCYLTKEFFIRAMRELPGLTDLRLKPGVPAMSNGGALVPYEATWTWYGVAGGMQRIAEKRADGSIDDCRIPVKVNNGMGIDAILGKAERKMRAAIYALLTGTEWSDGEADESRPAVIAVSNGSRSEQLAARLEAKAPAETDTNRNETPAETMGELAEESLAYAAVCQQLDAAESIDDVRAIKSAVRADSSAFSEQEFADLMRRCSERVAALKAQ